MKIYKFNEQYNQDTFFILKINEDTSILFKTRQDSENYLLNIVNRDLRSFEENDDYIIDIKKAIKWYYDQFEFYVEIQEVELVEKVILDENIKELVDAKKFNL